MRLPSLLCVAILAALFPAGAPAAGSAATRPSRAPVKGCSWEKIADNTLGLEAWVQRCDFGFRKIDFVVQGKALAVRYSDGGAPDPLVEVLDLLPGEKAETGMQRIFLEHTDAAVAKRCVMTPFRGSKRRPGARRFTFVPNARYQKELTAKADPNEVGDPPCGDWGDAPDGIQYFEVEPGAKSILFVRVGQDEPLFDEQTLTLIP